MSGNPMTIIKQLAAFSAILVFTACSSPPSKIAATAVASSEYADLSCSKMVRELSVVSGKLEEAERKQRNAVATDAVTVFFVLVPASALAGDNEANVARYKGEKLAIERAMSKKSC